MPSHYDASRKVQATQIQKFNLPFILELWASSLQMTTDIFFEDSMILEHIKADRWVESKEILCDISLRMSDKYAKLFKLLNTSIGMLEWNMIVREASKEMKKNGG